MSDFCAALNPYQDLVSREDCHALHDLPDGVFIPFCDCLCGILHSFFCLLHAGADAVCVGAALQDFFFLLFERSLLGQNFCKLRIAGFLIFCIDGFRQQSLKPLVELRQPTLDIGKTHGLTLHRQKL